MLRLVANLFVFTLLTAAPSAQAQSQPQTDARRARAERLLGMGRALASSGNPGSAVAYYRDAIGADPTHGTPYLLLGGIYLDRGNVSDAIDVYSAGLRRRPDHAPLWRGLAGAFEANGQLDDAATALRAYAERSPGDVEAHRARAELARRRGAWSEALGAYRAVIALAAEGHAPQQRRVETEHVAEARRYVAALVLFVGDLDPVTGPSRCSGSSVRRALADCD